MKRAYEAIRRGKRKKAASSATTAEDGLAVDRTVRKVDRFIHNGNRDKGESDYQGGGSRATFAELSQGVSEKETDRDEAQPNELGMMMRLHRLRGRTRTPRPSFRGGCASRRGLPCRLAGFVPVELHQNLCGAECSNTTETLIARYTLLATAVLLSYITVSFTGKLYLSQAPIFCLYFLLYILKFLPYLSSLP